MKKDYYEIQKTTNCWTCVNDFAQRIGVHWHETSGNQQLQAFCNYHDCCSYFGCSGLLPKAVTTSLNVSRGSQSKR